MQEVPLPQRPFLPLDDRECLAREHEEVLLVGLPVVHRHRLARLEDGESDAELRKDGPRAFEAGSSPKPLPPAPLGGAGVDDEPALAGR
jgi:hypothetical protein